MIWEVFCAKAPRKVLGAKHVSDPESEEVDPHGVYLLILLILQAISRMEAEQMLQTHGVAPGQYPLVR